MYIGLFGVLNKDAVIKNLNVAKAEIYTTSMSTTYVGGIAGAAQGNTRRDLYTGVLIDNCNVSGTVFLSSESGNNYVGGLIGRQYKGEIVNSSTNVNIRCVVGTGNYTAGAGGLVGLNNRGLIANCYSISNVYGSGCRKGGAEGMASIGNLVGVQSGTLVGCYTSGSTKTAEYSVCVGTVSGWITGTGSTYSCWYDEDSTMTVDNYVVNPVESVGTLVPSGVNEKGEAYTGGVISDIHGYTKDTYTSIVSELNSRFASYPVDISSIYKLGNSSLRAWTVKGGVVTLGESYGNVRYVKPQEKKNSESIAVPKDGIWYGSSKAGNYIVKIIVRDGRVIGEPEVIEDNISADDRVRNGYADSVKKEAVEGAGNKAIYADHTDYSKGDSTKFAGGNGTESDPYKIANEEQLRYLASSINCRESWGGKWFALTANITLSDKEWLPIGWSAQKEVRGKARVVAAYPFKGNFDGRNYTIRGLRIGTAASPADTHVAGLFGLTEGEYNSNDSLLNFKTTGKRAIVLRNIHLQDVSIYNKTRYESYSGGLLGCGQNGVFIDNCSVTGTISSVTAESFSRAAGLSTSIFRGAITNCWTNVEVYAETDVSGVYAGGMFATTNRATIFNCYALGNVTGKSTSNNKVHIGGFCGQDGGI